MGLSITLPMLQLGKEIFVAGLDCEQMFTEQQNFGIFLSLLPQANRYARIEYNEEALTKFTPAMARKSHTRNVYIRPRILEAYVPPLPIPHIFWIRTPPPKYDTYEEAENSRDSLSHDADWDRSNMTVELDLSSLAKDPDTSATIENPFMKGGKLKLGVNTDFQPFLEHGGGKVDKKVEFLDSNARLLDREGRTTALIYKFTGNSAHGILENKGGMNWSVKKGTRDSDSTTLLWIVDITESKEARFKRHLVIHRLFAEIGSNSECSTCKKVL
ncbi:MAG: hypothetical protein MMC23_001817 [Stictis urceolatum]|nr:hypothetical protein [Stictis urceolata]